MWARRSFSVLSRKVRIVEVGPRDGLQNEPASTILSAQVKSNFIKQLADAGLKTIEAGSFVSPKWVPQMANTGEVLGLLQKTIPSSIRLPVLVPNIKGLENALSHHPSEVSVFTAASEGFCKKNINMTIDESLQQIEKVIKRAAESKIPVRGYVSTIIGCPYDGKVDPKAVLNVSKELLNLGCYEISLGDTIGVGTPGDVKRLLQVLLPQIPSERLAVHFHDTYGQSLANILVALDHGIRVVDSAAAGLGGCPYAPGASGNVATEEVVYMLDGLGYESGVDLEKVVQAGVYITEALGRPNRSKVATAIIAKSQKQCK
jgi:hydroxymethylglutaryl-CoA lyase